MPVVDLLGRRVSVCWIHASGGEAFGRYGFDIHHRYSDRVKDFLDIDGLPGKGTFDYYAAMAQRDHIFKARRLAGSTPATTSPSLTFFVGNITYHLSALGFLHYVLVEVGTPNSTYLVALDTGSDRFWLHCDCTSCVRSLNVSGKEIFCMETKPYYAIGVKNERSGRVLLLITFCSLPERIQ